VHFSLRRRLENRLRERFDFGPTPIVPEIQEPREAKGTRMTSGWRGGARIASRAFANFLEDDGFDRSAAISYYALFSLVPFS